MITWPSILPDPTYAFSLDIQDTVISTQMDTGYTRVRPRFTCEFGQSRVEWEMTDDQFVIFRAWHAEKLNLGSAPFYIQLPTGRYGLTQQTVRFDKGVFQAKAVPVDHWLVTATLNVEKPTRLQDGIIDLYLDPVFVSEFDDFRISIDNLIELTDVTFPDLLI